MKILVIQQKMIGDVLTSSIIFEALRKEFPAAELHYLIYPNTRAVVENNPFIDKIVEFDPRFNFNIIGFLKFLNEIKSHSYDVVIDPYSKISTGIMAIYSGATTRVSFHKEYTKQFYSHTYRYKTKPDTNAGLAIENRMLLLQALNANFPNIARPVIYIAKEEKLDARKKFLAAGLNPRLPIVMCGILGSSRTKSYPAPFMAKVLDEIVEQVENVQLLFNYIPSQEPEAEKILQLCSEATRKRFFAGLYEKSLRGFIKNCSLCDLYIGNEGGAANIAKALSIPTLSIYSPFIKKTVWATFEDGERNISIHPGDFSQHAPGSYKDLPPEAFKDTLKSFLQKNINKKIQNFS